MELSWQEGRASPQQSPLLTWLLPCTKHFPGEPSCPHPFLQLPFYPLPQMGKPRHREMQGLAWGLVAIEEPGCVEERPVAASLAGSLPPDALGL